MASDTEEPELDADGLVIQKYDSMVLVIVPPDGFSDQILRYARSSLYNIHVGTWSVTTNPEIEVKGRLQDAFLCDGDLTSAKLEDYSGVIVAGCEGEHPFATNQTVLSLVREAHGAGKLVAGWGNSLSVFAAAGIVKGRKVTGSATAEDAVKRAGGRYSTRQVEAAGHLVTALDEGAGMRFGQAIVEAVRIL